MTDTWRVELADLRTDRTLANLEASSVEFDRLIGKAGSLACQITIPDRATADLIRPCETQRTAVYVYRGDRDIWWSGILWRRPISRPRRGQHKVQLQAAGFESYPYRVVDSAPIGADFKTGPYTDLDQLEIARRIISEMQSSALLGHGNIRLTVDSQNSGVLRTISWAWGAIVSYGQALEEVADTADGFEFTVDAFHDSAGVRRRHVRLGYPQLGRADAEHELSDPGNILDWSWDEDGTRGATRTWAQGAAVAQGNSVLPINSSYYWDFPRLAAGWPYLAAVEQFTDERDWDRIGERGVAARDRHFGGAVVLPSVSVRLSDTDLSPQHLGDTVRIRIDDAWWSPPLDAAYRMIGFKVKPPERDQEESLTVTLEVPRAAA